MSTKTTKAQDLLNRISISLKQTISRTAQEEQSRKAIDEKNAKKDLSHTVNRSTAMLMTNMRIL